MSTKYYLSAVATLLIILISFGACKKADTAPTAYNKLPGGSNTITYPGFVYTSGSVTNGAAGPAGPNGAAGSAGNTYISIIHAAPKTGALDIAIDKNRLYLNFFNFTDRVDYFQAFTGLKAFSVYESGGIDALFAKNMQFDPGKFYSVFIADTLSKMDAIIIRDSSLAPGPDSVKIRFINMSPDVGNLDLYVRGKEVKVAGNIGYKEASPFISVKAGNDIYLDARPQGEKGIWGSTAKMNLLNGNIYTIWATGFIHLNSEDGRIRVETIRH